MGVEDKELFYSPEHKDRKELQAYEIDDVCEVVQLKAYLRRERQIAETRLKAIEQRDRVIAALSATRGQSDEGRLEALEARLNSEIRDRSELASKLQQYHSQVEEYKGTLRRIVAKLEAVVKREIWRLPENLRPALGQLQPDDASPAGFLNSVALLLERLNAVVTQVLEVSRAEVEKANTNSGSVDRWKQLVKDREADVAQAQMNINALKATNKLFENNIKVAENQARTLQEALDQAHQAAEKDAETFQTLQTMLDVAQSRNNDLSATCGQLQSQLKEARDKEISNQAEIQRLQDLLARNTSSFNQITLPPPQNPSSSTEAREIHQITSTEEHVTVTEVTMSESVQVLAPESHGADVDDDYPESSDHHTHNAVNGLFYTARNSRDEADARRDTLAMPSRANRTSRRRKQQSPSELASGETAATEARADGSSSIGTSPDSIANTTRAMRSKKVPAESMTLRTVETPPRRRTRRAAI